MAESDLKASWKRTTDLLLAARELLPQRDGDGTRDFLEYIGHSEFGLAFDVLVEIGVSQGALRAFWECLRDATVEMKIVVEDGVHGRSLQTVHEWIAKEDLYPCPCCGHLVFRELPGSYDNCPVCGWEDDIAQLRFPTVGGANRPLVECQADFIEMRQSAEQAESPEDLGYILDPGWRPIDLTKDEIQRPVIGVEYGPTYVYDSTSYYYWRTQK